MSDIIRDVLIRVGIQKANEAIDPPDVKAAIDRVNEITEATQGATAGVENAAQAQVDAVTKALATLEAEAVKTFEKMSQAAMDAASGDKAQTAEAEKLLDSLQKQADEIEELKKARAELQAQIAAEAKAEREREKAAQEAAKAEKDAIRERDQALKELAGMYASAQRGQMQALEGVLALTRAAAVFAASDKSAKELLQTLAEFQAVGDVLKGLQQIYDGLAVTIQIASRIKEAEAAASARVAAANTAVAATAGAAATATAGQAAAAGAATAATTGAGGAMAGLAAVLNPVTIVIAAAAGGLWLWVRASREAREATEALNATYLKMTTSEYFEKGLQRRGLNAGAWALQGDRTRQDNARADLERSLLGGGDQEAALGGDIQAAVSRAQELERKRNERYELDLQLRQAQLEMAERLKAQGIATPDLPNAEADAAKQSLPLLEQAREQIERAIALTREQHNVRKDILQSQERELEIQQRQLETERERVSVEKERAEDVARGLGRVSRDDIEKAKIAADKLTAGQDLTDEDIAAADRLSFGGRSAALEAAAAKRRAASGIDAVRAGLGFESPEEAIKRAEEQQNQINGLLRETNEALNQTRQQQVELQTATLEAVKTLSTELARLQGVINDIKDNIQANGG